MRYTFEVKNEIKRCGDCPCNMCDGHEFYCKLSKKFNVDPKKDCKLIPINYDPVRRIAHAYILEVCRMTAATDPKSFFNTEPISMKTLSDWCYKNFSKDYTCHIDKDFLKHLRDVLIELKESNWVYEIKVGGTNND